MREALEKIAAPDYGLQGIYEDNGYEDDQEVLEYYRSLVRYYQKIAREALLKGDQ